jgi:hypothetical protein
MAQRKTSQVVTIGGQLCVYFSHNRNSTLKI